MNAAMIWITALTMLTALTQWEDLTVSVLKDSLEMVSQIAQVCEYIQFYHYYFRYVYIFLLTDIDECATDQNNCTHNCSDTIGSYICSCTQGYALAADGFHCDGNLMI